MPKFLTNLDLNKNQLLNTVIQNLAVEPSSPAKGQMYFDTVSNTFRVWNGTQWLAGGSGELPDLIISNISGLQSALNEKVDNSRVLKDVPANANFSDTVTTVNGKTGTITKADIVALGIPASDTNTTYSDATPSVSGLMSGTDKTKLNGIESNANNYSHPTGDGNLHVPSTGTTNNNKVLKAGATAGSLVWSEDKDTVTTINGKTGVIVKADIVALGIPASDTNTIYSDATASVAGLMSNTDKTKVDGISTGANKVINHANNGSISVDGIEQVVYVHPTGTNPHSTTKADVGLGSVDNTSDLAKPVSAATQVALDLKESIANVNTKVTTAENAAKLYADTEIAKLIGEGTSEALDTLKELAAALGNDPNFATTIMMELSAKTEQYVQSIGNGTLTSFDISHSMGTRNVTVQVRQTGSPFAVVYTDIEMFSDDVVRIKFAQPPATDEYTVAIIGSGTSLPPLV